MPDFLELKTRDDLQRLVDEGLEEGLTLDYKASPGMSRQDKYPNEMCKDVTALANSAGGQIIYGVAEGEEKGKPERVDEGVTDPKITREWIMQILNSRVQPRMNGVTVDQIAMPTGSAFVISVPPTTTGPHQAPDKRYYKRFELHSVPMEDYEVRDVMARGAAPSLYVNFHFETGDTSRLEYAPQTEVSNPVGLLLYIGNHSQAPALYTQITVGLDPDMPVVDTNGWIPQGLDDYDGVTLNGFRRPWSVPARLPIFKEAEQGLPPLLFTIHSNFLASTLFQIAVAIQTPGFSSLRHWTMTCNSATLRLAGPIPKT